MHSSPLQTLISVLSGELALCRRLESLLGEEQKALQSLDAPSILALVNEKDSLALQLRALEESRRLAVERFAGELRLEGDPEGLSLEQIAAAAPPREAAELRALARSLREAVAAGQTRNSTNRVLTDHSLKLTRETLRVLAQPDDVHKTYRASGALRAYRIEPQVVARRI